MRKLALLWICLAIAICLFTGTKGVLAWDDNDQGWWFPQCVQPPGGLTGWWPGDGNTRDIIGGRNAVLHNATYGPGFVDQAFRLDGDGDWVEVPNAPNIGTQDFTIDLWVFFNDTAGEQVLVERFISSWVDYNSSRGWTLVKMPENYLRFTFCGWVADEGLSRCDNIDSCWLLPIPARTWNLFAVTREDRWFTFFMNGVPITVAERPVFNVDSMSSLKFGHRGGPDDTPGSDDNRGVFLNGRIDEVELFVGRALSQEEIQGIFNAGRAGKCKRIFRY